MFDWMLLLCGIAITARIPFSVQFQRASHPIDDFSGHSAGTLRPTVKYTIQ
jgi:hypothetical protein